ncbi:MAG: phosphodiester glycosidase family protein [Myxococcota bacterium]
MGRNWSIIERLVWVGIAALAIFSAPRSTHAEDVWSDPHPGVRYVRRTTPRLSAHGVVVDTRVRGVAVEATAYDDRWQTVGEFGRSGGYAVAVNGGFWDATARAQGVTAGGGERWPQGHDDEEHGFFAIGRDGRAWISPPSHLFDAPPRARLAHAVTGRPMLVQGGHVDHATLDELEWARYRHPRTAAGTSRDGRTVVLVVVDGRQPHSRGMTLYELAEFLIELGAHSAINLDGGGSTAMYVERLGGVVNSPSGGRWEARLGLGPSVEEPSKVRVARDGIEEQYVRGVEREVLNHLGVRAPAPDPGQLTEFESIPFPDHGVTIAPPRPPAFRLGRNRELLYPVAYGVAAAIPLMLLIVLGVRWRRRRVRLAVRDPASPRAEVELSARASPGANLNG